MFLMNVSRSFRRASALCGRDVMQPPVLDLRGRAAVVTGASSGIGAAVARGLARAGARVAVNYRSHPEGAAAVVEAIRAEGGEAIACRADVSREEEVERLFGETVAAFGTVHALVA